MRHIHLLLAAALVVSGCSGGDEASEGAAPAEPPAASAPASNSPAEDESADAGDGGAETDSSLDTSDLDSVGDIEVDRGLFSVEITFPADFLGEDDPVEFTDGIAAEQGIEWGEQTVNPDGSVTVKMSRGEHEQLMDGLRDAFDESLGAMPSNYESVQSATANRDYDEFDIVVDRAAFESSFDGFVSFEILLTAGIFGIFNGDDPDNARLEIRFADAATGEVFDTLIAPDDFQE